MSERTSKPKVTGKAKVLHYDITMIAAEGLLDETGCGGQYSGPLGAITYDPDFLHQAATKIHELIHAHREALGISNHMPDAKDEEQTGLAETCICTFVRQNPKMSMELLRELIGDKAWQRILKSMKP